MSDDKKPPIPQDTPLVPFGLRDPAYLVQKRREELEKKKK